MSEAAVSSSHVRTEMLPVRFGNGNVVCDLDNGNFKKNESK